MTELIIELIGYTAGVLIATTMIPQIRLALKTKNVTALSTLMLLLFLFSMFLWALYGFLIKSYPLLITNGFATIIAFIQLYIKLKYSNLYNYKRL